MWEVVIFMKIIGLLIQALRVFVCANKIDEFDHAWIKNYTKFT